MFVVTLEYRVPLPEVDALLPAHREWLDRLLADGHLVACGPRVPRTGGVIVARAASRGQLNALLATDPLHQARAAAYTVVEFTAVRGLPDLLD
ncbi:hypothetical protein GCM10010124_16390 [Pilimelia terevasa]|uniref:YCII-related domain-containing protein n=1 Tax=Pilimelia terevasa TaxID=53372 RepID=A0A8J3BNW0_9ACTN|nr:YciI family protein [Pilimelia terevasa]GGK24590.1 hypothetical protein GCM10010124_16390 [Pilimelia terevasa]